MSFLRACGLSELADSTPLRVEVDGLDVALVRHDNEVFAIEEDVAGPEDLVDPETEREVMVVVLPPTVARAFCERAEAVVSAGRPSCDFCGNPLDPDGHLCPRMNGFRRR